MICPKITKHFIIYSVIHKRVFTPFLDLRTRIIEAVNHSSNSTIVFTENFTIFLIYQVSLCVQHPLYKESTSELHRFRVDLVGINHWKSDSRQLFLVEFHSLTIFNILKGIMFLHQLLVSITRHQDDLLSCCSQMYVYLFTLIHSAIQSL